MPYNGPRTRHRQEYTGDSVSVNGRVNYLEERGMMIQQRFKVTQTREEGTDDFVNPVYYELTEAPTVNPGVGEDVPFSSQVEYPRLSLASSFTRLNFKPDNSHNSTEQNVEVESLLSPYLCSKQKFENVVAVPRVTPQRVSTVQRQNFTAQLGFHGRFWFGILTDGDKTKKYFGATQTFLSTTNFFNHLQLFLKT